MTSYFYTTKKGEVYELRMELNSERQECYTEVIYVIALPCYRVGEERRYSNGVP